MWVNPSAPPMGGVPKLWGWHNLSPGRRQPGAGALVAHLYGVWQKQAYKYIGHGLSHSGVGWCTGVGLGRLGTQLLVPEG